MNIISIDLELNQPSGKIIELGYTIANVKTQKIIFHNAIFINPEESISHEIIELTGITDNDVKDGKSLTEAYNIMCEDIKKWEVNKHPIQWGSDHIELRKQLDITWEDYIFRFRAHDIKSLYQMWAMCQPNGKIISGLSKSMERLGLEFMGTQHNAADDAYNTLRVMFELQNKFKKFEQIKKLF